MDDIFESFLLGKDRENFFGRGGQSVESGLENAAAFELGNF